MTIADIARLARVSKATVSAVLNNRPGIGAETRQQVLEIIRRVDYTPSDLARGLSRQRTGTWGLVVKDITNPFYAQITQAIEAVAHENGFGLLLCSTGEDHGKEIEVLRMLKKKRVDGLILVPIQEHVALDHLFALRREAVPHVLISPPIKGLTAHYVYNDDTGGAVQAIEHLLGLGHRRIAYLGGPDTSTSNIARLAGYRQTLLAAGITPRPEWVVPAGADSRGGQRALRILLAAGLAGPEWPTAILCYNDLVAIGVLQALMEAGLRVPVDVAVVGFDNIEVDAVLNPPLTSIHIPRYELGLTSAHLLLRLLSEDPPPAPVEKVLGTELVARASTTGRAAG